MLTFQKLEILTDKQKKLTTLYTLMPLGTREWGGGSCPPFYAIVLKRKGKKSFA